VIRWIALTAITVLAQEPALIADAKQLVRSLEEKKFVAATAKWNPDMAKTLPAPKVEQFWTGLVAQVGPLKSIGVGAVKQQGPFQTVTLPVIFEKAELVASVTYDAKGKVAGLYFNPKT
jgi:uncharacterized protein